VSNDRFPISGAIPIPVEAGDAIFFHYLLVHGSGTNVSNEPRTRLLIQLRGPSGIRLSDRHSSLGPGMVLAGIDPTVQGFAFAWQSEAVLTARSQQVFADRCR
jgi:phytanoyl-CoA hydroxylase